MVNILKKLFPFLNKDFKSNKFVSNTFFIILTTIVTSLAGFLFWFIASKLYSVSEVGLASTLISALLLFMTLSLVGLDVALVRFLEKSKSKTNLINTFLTISGLLGIFLAVIFILGINCWSAPLNFLLDPILGLLFVIFTFFLVLGRMIDDIYTAKRISECAVERNFIFSLLKIIFLPLFFIFNNLGIFFSFGFAALISVVYSIFIQLPRIIRGFYFKLMIDLSQLKGKIKFSFVNYLSLNFMFVYTSIMPILITNILSPYFTAIFYISWKICGLIFLASSAVFSGLLAEGSFTKKNIRINIQKARNFSFLAIFILILVIILFGKTILSFFGGDYVTGYEFLKIVSFSAIFFPFIDTWLAVLNLKHEKKKLLVINSLRAAIAIFGGIFLISYGLIGIAIAWGIANFITAVFSIADLKKEGFFDFTDIL